MIVGQTLFFSHPTVGVYTVQVTGVTNATTVVLNFIINTTPAGTWTVTNNPWAQAAGNKVVTTSSVLSIAVAKGDSNRVYTGGMDSQVWYSTDAGVTAGNWTRIDLADLGAGSLPNRPVSDIAVNPGNKNQVWITMQGASTTARVARCDDVTKPQANREWKRLGGNGLPDIPANCIAVDPDNPTTNLFVGTDSGLYYSKDGGATWSHANNIAASRMPANIKITDLDVVGTGIGRTLSLSTYGRGIWRVSIITL